MVPCILAQMPLLAPLVDRTRAAGAAVGTRGYAGPDGLGCTDVTAIAIAIAIAVSRLVVHAPAKMGGKHMCCHCCTTATAHMCLRLRSALAHQVVEVEHTY